MRQGEHASHLIRALVVCGLLVLTACRAPVPRPTEPSGFRVVLPAASQTMPQQPLPLTVRVTDADGRPVDDVPVHFRILQHGTARAEADPPTVLTQDGCATSAFRAQTAGQAAVEIRVEHLTGTVWISVLGETPRF